MRRITLFAAFIGALVAAGCNEQKTAEAPPAPIELMSSAIGHYCGMSVLEHTGPKGQIILASRKEPIWFSSARDTLSFTMLPEEPKDIRAIYVSDMAKAPSWDKPGAKNWIDAKTASFVLGSRMKGGMGADEAVPFSDRGSAEIFAKANGGRVVAFAEIPKDYVLGAGAGAETTSAIEGARGATDAHHKPAAPKASEPDHTH